MRSASRRRSAAAMSTGSRTSGSSTTRSSSTTSSSTSAGGDGALALGAFHKSAAGVAQDADDRIIYDTDSGALFYDADGTGHRRGRSVCDAEHRPEPVRGRLHYRLAPTTGGALARAPPSPANQQWKESGR